MDDFYLSRKMMCLPWFFDFWFLSDESYEMFRAGRRHLQETTR